MGPLTGEAAAAARGPPTGKDRQENGVILDTDSATFDFSCDLIIPLDKTGGGGTIRKRGGWFLQSSTKAACSGRIISVPPDAVRLFVTCHLSFFVICRLLENALRFWRVPRLGPGEAGRGRPVCKAVEDTIPKGCLPERDPEGRQDKGDDLAVG